MPHIYATPSSSSCDTSPCSTSCTSLTPSGSVSLDSNCICMQRTQIEQRKCATTRAKLSLDCVTKIKDFHQSSYLDFVHCILWDFGRILYLHIKFLSPSSLRCFAPTIVSNITLAVAHLCLGLNKILEYMSVHQHFR